MEPLLLYSYSPPYYRALYPLAVGFLLVLGVRVFVRTDGRQVAQFMIGLMMTALAIAVAISLHFESRQIAHVREIGEARTITGVVIDFIPGSENLHRKESFSVQGVRFEYVGYDGGPGFNQATADGGPLVAGFCLKIQYFHDRNLGNRILSLEQLPAQDCKTN